METIGQQEIWTFIGTRPAAAIATNEQVRIGQACRVGSFVELARKMAELQFRNRDHVLVFRGQGSDFKNREGETTLKPTLFRPARGQATPPDRETLRHRYQLLEVAEQLLVQLYEQAELLASDRLGRQRILRWSILQHYEVCDTPLLDVTHSLRIAASFATLRTKAQGLNDAFLFVLGVPNLSGAMTASAEAGLQIVRLASVCPPTALRPHIQEGYLLGEYPDMLSVDQKRLYEQHEIDFGRRLIAKFVFDTKSFWKRGAFSAVGKNALYPLAKHDGLSVLTQRVKLMSNQQV